MFRKISAAILVSAMPLMASADWVAGGDYATLDADDISLSALVGSIGYRFPLQSESHSIIAGVRYGLGVGDDSFPAGQGESIDVELDSFMALEATYEYDFGNNFYIQGTLSWADIETEASYNGQAGSFSASVSESEVGYGIGAGYKFSDALGAELSYETYDETDYLALGLRFNF